MSQTLEGDALASFRDGFAGTVHAQDDSGYEEARSIFNSMIEKRPAAIAQVTSPDDIAAALAFARENGLEVAVRGGGHSVAGASLTDGGVTIDMRKMNNVTVDPDARTATAQGGALWGDFDRATQGSGLMAPGGRVSTTGVAGLTLGGGSCWLERKFGMAADNLLSVELITADGRTVRASEDENPELFWALHGGGGNFGIATELTFRLHEMPAATFGVLLWSAERGEEVSRTYRDMMDNGAPEELGGCLIWISAPEEEFVPKEMQNTLVCGVVVYYAGPEAGAREALAPGLDLEMEGGILAEMPYADMQCALDDPPGYRNWWSAEYLPEFSDEALDAYVERAPGMVIPSPTLHTAIPLGGAVARGAKDSQLAFREAAWTIHPLSLWEDPGDDEQAISWARGVMEDMKPHSLGATYPNFIGDEGERRIVGAYGEENYNRLAEVKAEYDPDDVFHLHHPIRPLATA